MNQWYMIEYKNDSMTYGSIETDLLISGWKMVKHALKIVRCENISFLMCVWPFFNIMHERVNQPDYKHIKQTSEAATRDVL